jgi:uncharacterized protein DUF2809
MNPRSRQALLWTAIIIAVGLIIRRAPLHLPAFITKFGGSILWGAMVYAIFVALFPRRRPIELGAAAGFFALAVELFKLVHAPAIDAFRQTLAGQLLIGRVFSYVDILAYCFGIAAFAAMDNLRLRRVVTSYLR